MNLQHPIKCRCDFCPAELEATWGQIGELVFCPGCGMETTVREPAVMVPPPLPKPSRAKIFMRAAMVVASNHTKGLISTVAFFALLVGWAIFLLWLPVSQPAALNTNPTIVALELKDAIRERVSIVSWHHSRGGFGAVMEATFTVKNSSSVAIKDISITCEHFGNSGTKIGRNTCTIYEVVNSGQVKTFEKINMGFVHSQAASSTAHIEDFELLSR